MADALAECRAEKASPGDFLEFVVEFVEQILVPLPLPRTLRLVVLALVDELIHHLLLGLATVWVPVFLGSIVISALERGLEPIIVLAAAEVKRPCGGCVHSHVVIRVVVPHSPSTPRDGVRGPALLLTLVDGFAAVRQGDWFFVVVALAVVVVVVEVEPGPALDLPQACAREPSDGALLWGHARVVFAKSPVDEGV